MLSQHHHRRRTLAEIEEHLRESDPELAHLLQRFDDWAPPRRRELGTKSRFVGAAGLWLGAVLLTTAVIDANADALILAAAFLLLDAAWWLLCLVNLRVRPWLQERRGRRGAQPPPPPDHERGAF